MMFISVLLFLGFIHSFKKWVIVYLPCTRKYAKHCIRTENKTIMDCSQVAYNLGGRKRLNVIIQISLIAIAISIQKK